MTYYIYCSCEDTVEKHKYLEEDLSVDVIVTSDIDSIPNPEYCMAIPEGSIVDAFQLNKMLSVKADAYYYRTLVVKDAGTDHKYKADESYVRFSDGDVEHTHSEPVVLCENKRYGLQVHIQTSNRCTKTCKWCPPYHRKPEKTDYVSDEILFHMFDIIEDYGIGNVKSIQVSRISEVTRNLDYLRRVSTMVKKRFPTSQIAVVSNGYGLRHNPKDVVKKAIENVDLLMVNDYDEEDGPGSMKNLLQQFGDSRGGDYHQEDVRVEPMCWDLERRVSIDWDGMILACCRTTAVAPNQAQYRIGNILECKNWEEVDACRKAFKMVPDCSTCVDSMQQSLKRWDSDKGPFFARVDKDVTLPRDDLAIPKKMATPYKEPKASVEVFDPMMIDVKNI